MLMHSVVEAFSRYSIPSQEPKVLRFCHTSITTQPWPLLVFHQGVIWHLCQNCMRKIYRISKSPFKDCGILNLLEPGDGIMADKGFDIVDGLPEGITLNIPPFLHGSQFSEQEELATRRVAKSRIHVERAIGKIKNFRILQYTLPISMAADINKIWVVCFYLTLFSRSLINS